MCLRVFEEQKEASIDGAGDAGRRMMRGGGGASFCRILQAVVRTLAFIPNEMGALGMF